MMILEQKRIYLRIYLRKPVVMFPTKIGYRSSFAPFLKLLPPTPTAGIVTHAFF